MTTAPEPICRRCGAPISPAQGEELICDECYRVAGSCCQEFEPDDE